MGSIYLVSLPCRLRASRGAAISGGYGDGKQRIAGYARLGGKRNGITLRRAGSGGSVSGLSFAIPSFDAVVNQLFYDIGRSHHRHVARNSPSESVLPRDIRISVTPPARMVTRRRVSGGGDVSKSGSETCNAQPLYKRLRNTDLEIMGGAATDGMHPIPLHTFEDLLPVVPRKYQVFSMI